MKWNQHRVLWLQKPMGSPKKVLAVLFPFRSFHSHEKATYQIFTWWKAVLYSTWIVHIPGLSEAWKTAETPQEAMRLYIDEVKRVGSRQPDLLLALDARDTDADRDHCLIYFYKDTRDMKMWAATFKCRILGICWPMQIMYHFVFNCSCKWMIIKMENFVDKVILGGLMYTSSCICLGSCRGCCCWGGCGKAHPVVRHCKSEAWLSS